MLSKLENLTHRSPDVVSAQSYGSILWIIVIGATLLVAFAAGYMYYVDWRTRKVWQRREPDTEPMGGAPTRVAGLTLAQVRRAREIANRK
jgi:hypothetical protein